MVGRDAEAHEPPRRRQALDHVHLDGKGGSEKRPRRIEAGRTGSDDRNSQSAHRRGCSGAAAGAAAADLGRVRVVFDLERVAAAAGGNGVRVVDLEPGFLDRLEIVDAGARRYGALNGSTTTFTPSHSNSWSPSWAPWSKPRPYWKPEQPPPSIATRSTETSVSSAISAQIFSAADGVSETSCRGSLLNSIWLASYQRRTRSRSPAKGGVCNTHCTVVSQGPTTALWRSAIR